MTDETAPIGTLPEEEEPPQQQAPPPPPPPPPPPDNNEPNTYGNTPNNYTEPNTFNDEPTEHEQQIIDNEVNIEDEHDEDSDHNLVAEIEEIVAKDSLRLKKWLAKVVRSPKYEKIIVFLVCLDIFITVIELSLDITQDSHVKQTGKKDEPLVVTSHILHYVGMAVLGLFVIELIVATYAMGIKEYFNHFWHVLDAFIVMLSFIVDVYVAVQEAQDEHESHVEKEGEVNSMEIPLGIIVVLQLGRICRVFFGLTLPIRIRTEEKYQRFRRKTQVLRDEIKTLRKELKRLRARNNQAHGYYQGYYQGHHPGHYQGAPD